MPRTATPTDPRPPAPPCYRILQTLEDGQGGFHRPGDIVALALTPQAIGILLERGVIMPSLDPATIAALPDDVA